MNKQDRHRVDLGNLIDELLCTGDRAPLVNYILANSSLPGRRANLELAQAFREVIERNQHREINDRLWQHCSALVEISPDEAPVNTPQEFLPFCGAMGIGAIGTCSQKHFDHAYRRLITLSNDPRWRTREAVGFGIQHLVSRNREAVLVKMEASTHASTLLEKRALVAGIAEPTLLENYETAKAALRFHKTILTQIEVTQERSDENFKVLRKALAFTLSVVVCAIPGPGFALIRQLIELHDRDIAWIVKQNLKKNRLIRQFPQEVESLQARFTTNA